MSESPKPPENHSGSIDTAADEALAAQDRLDHAAILKRAAAYPHLRPNGVGRLKQNQALFNTCVTDIVHVVANSPSVNAALPQTTTPPSPLQAAWGVDAIRAAAIANAGTGTLKFTLPDFLPCLLEEDDGPCDAPVLTASVSTGGRVTVSCRCMDANDAGGDKRISFPVASAEVVACLAPQSARYTYDVPATAAKTSQDEFIGNRMQPRTYNVTKGRHGPASSFRHTPALASVVTWEAVPEVPLAPNEIRRSTMVHREEGRTTTTVDLRERRLPSDLGLRRHSETLVTSSMDTGKTFQIIQTDEETLCTEVTARMVYVTESVTRAEGFVHRENSQLAEDGLAPRWVVYNDKATCKKRSLYEHQLVVVCIDSVHRLLRAPGVAGADRDFVILDESETVVSRMAKVRKNNAVVGTTFDALVRDARNVICLDAFMGVRTQAHIDRHRPESAVGSMRCNVRNTHPAMRGTTVLVAHDEISWLCHVFETVQCGKKAGIPCASKAMAMALAAAIRRLMPQVKVCLITGDTDTSAKRDFCRDTRATWPEFDVIIYTMGTIGTGTDFTVDEREEPHFDAVFVWLSGGSNTAFSRDGMQSALRIRQLKSCLIVVGCRAKSTGGAVPDLDTVLASEPTIRLDRNIPFEDAVELALLELADRIERAETMFNPLGYFLGFGIRYGARVELEAKVRSLPVDGIRFAAWVAYYAMRNELNRIREDPKRKHTVQLLGGGNVLSSVQAFHAACNPETPARLHRLMMLVGGHGGAAGAVVAGGVVDGALASELEGVGHIRELLRAAGLGDGFGHDAIMVADLTLRTSSLRGPFGKASRHYGLKNGGALPRIGDVVSEASDKAFVHALGDVLWSVVGLQLHCELGDGDAQMVRVDPVARAELLHLCTCAFVGSKEGAPTMQLPEEMRGANVTMAPWFKDAYTTVFVAEAESRAYAARYTTPAVHGGEDLDADPHVGGGGGGGVDVDVMQEGEEGEDSEDLEGACDRVKAEAERATWSPAQVRVAAITEELEAARRSEGPHDASVVALENDLAVAKTDCEREAANGSSYDSRRLRTISARIDRVLTMLDAAKGRRDTAEDAQEAVLSEGPRKASLAQKIPGGVFMPVLGECVHKTKHTECACIWLQPPPGPSNRVRKPRAFRVTVALALTLRSPPPVAAEANVRLWVYHVDGETVAAPGVRRPQPRILTHWGVRPPKSVDECVASMEAEQQRRLAEGGEEEQEEEEPEGEGEEEEEEEEEDTPSRKSRRRRSRALRRGGKAMRQSGGGAGGHAAFDFAMEDVEEEELLALQRRQAKRSRVSPVTNE